MNMNDKRSCNTSIRCSVDTCAYHSGAQTGCSLDSNTVGCGAGAPTNCEGTLCASYMLGTK